jgi:hypothetical protein
MSESDWEDVPSKPAAHDSDWEDVPKGAATATAEAPTDEEIEAAYGPDVTPKMRAALKSGVAPMQKPTQFEQDRPRPEGGVISQGLGTIGRQIKNAVVGSVAPYTKGYETYEDIRSQGGGVLPAIAGGVARGLASSTTGVDPFEAAQSAQDIPGEYKQRREAGYSPAYAALAPTGAQLTQIDLPTMEAAARAGNVPGVIAEAAVPAGEAALGAAAHELPFDAGDVVKKAAFGTPLTEAGRREAAVKQGMVVAPPRMSETGYAQRMQEAVPDLQRVAQDNAGKIKTPRDAVEGMDQRIGQMESPIGEHLANHPEVVVHPDEYVADLESRIDQELRNAPAKLTEKEIIAAKNKVDELFNQEGAQPISEMERIRRRLNTDAQDYFKSRPADKRVMDTSDATAIAQRAAADYLRERLYGTDAAPGWLERAGVTAVDMDGRQVPMAEYRKRVGNLIEVRNHFEDAIVRAEKAGDWEAISNIFKGPSLAAGGIGALGGLVSGGFPGLVLGSAIGEAAKIWGDYLRSKNPNLNVQKMFRNLERSGTPQTLGIRTQAPPVIPTVPAVAAPERPFEITQPPGGGVIAPRQTPQTNWQTQVGGLPPIGFGEPGFEGKPMAPGEATHGPTTAPAPLGPIQMPEGRLQGPQGGQQLEMNLPGQQHELFNLSHPAPRAPAAPPTGLGGIEGAELRPEVGKLGKINTTAGENLKVGDTFVDEKGDPRRIVGIEEDGTIKTADHTLRDYPQGEVRHLGDINSPQARLAHGGMMHEAGEPVEIANFGKIGEKPPEIETPKGFAPSEEENPFLRLGPRKTPQFSPDDARAALAKNVESVNAQRAAAKAPGEWYPQENNFRILKPGEQSAANLHDASFLLDDGSMLSDSRARSHMQLAREIGQDHLNDNGAIRVVSPDSYELHSMPTEAQLAEMNRLVRELPREGAQSIHDKGYVYWDFYPEETRGYSADAVHERHETGAGTFADFRRAMDDYYKPTAVEPDRVVNGRGVFDKPVSEEDLAAGRKPVEEEEEEKKFGPDDVRISTRTPTAKGATENPHTTPLSVNLDAVHETEGLPEKLADVVKKYPDMKKAIGNVKDPKVALERFVQHISDNLEWLHNQMPPEVREITRKWYDSANTMAKDMADRYGYDEKQMAGVIASLSPQKDWNMNVSLADRVADTVKNKSDIPFSDEMLKKAKDLTAEGSNAAMKSLLKNIKGKTLAEVKDPLERAAWIRLYDEAHNSRSYNNIAPNGKVLGKATNVNGAESKVAWGSLNEIAKAANIIEDGSRENISRQLGEMHKVRNFYNNIADPGSEHPDVTVDTHAVAAGHIQPFSGNSHEVQQNFGGPGSAITGVNGTYPLYAEAYRRAAEKLGLKPRELQSIVWEQVRDLFPAEWKTKANAAKVADIWNDYGKGKIKIGEARQKIVDLAGGFKKPEWLGALD